MVQNKALTYTCPPNGMPIPGKDLTVTSREFDLSAPAPPGGLVVQNHYLSYDPFQRGKLRDPSIVSYNTAYTLNAPLHNMGLARVVKSDYPGLEAGDIVVGECFFEEYSVLSREFLDSLLGSFRYTKLENPYKVEWGVFLGPLGMSGWTAYSALYAIGKPKKGETIWVTAASGGVGQVVGQLAKREGLRVIGCVGDDEKVKILVENFGYDGGFNYKKEDAREALKRLAPNGVDIYWDNVGGEMLDIAFEQMNNWGRVVSCGSVSQTSLPPSQQYGLKNSGMIVRKRLTLRGFIVYDADIGQLYDTEHKEKIGAWIRDGSFKTKISITEGIDEAAEGFVGMLKGHNVGKAVLRIREF